MKHLSLLLAAALLLCVLSGCAVAPAAPDAPAKSGFTALSLTDQAGRSVELTAAPQRIVSGYYISTSLLIALGQQDKLVGIEAKAAQRPIYALSAPALLELPDVGSAKNFDLEGCAALEPDLVILPLKLKDAAASLEALGIPVLLVNPENQALLEEMTRLLGEATSSTDRAGELLDFIHGQQTRLQEALTGTDAPEVYLASNSDLLSTAGGNMYQSGLLQLAGGSNTARELEDSYWAAVDYEQILAWNPAWIVLPSDAGYSVEEVLANPALTDCAAVRDSSICQIPGVIEAWDSPVPGSVLGALWLASVLHPDCVDAAQCRTTIQKFYERFYGIAPTDPVYDALQPS